MGEKMKEYFECAPNHVHNNTNNSSSATTTKYRERPKHRSWCDVFYEFTQNTTFHGIRYVTERRTLIIRRLLWLLLICTCSGIMVFQIVDRIIFYCRFPVTVNVEINFNKTIRFPAVAICNQNAFRITEAARLGYLNLLEEIYNEKPDKQEKLDNLTRNNYSQVNFEDLYLPTAHLKEDMIVRCFWDGSPCSHENFTMILTDHGVCYAFNGDQAHPLYISDTGTEHGLRLTVNVEQYEYMHGPHDSAGLKVLLYDTDEVPLVYELGQAVATGTHTFIGVKVLVMKYLPGPHGNCSGSNVLEHFPVYSETGCKLECMKDFYEKRCGCRMFYMPQKDGVPPVCNLGQYFSCVLNAKEEFNHPGKDICKCPLPCSTTIYEPNFSYSATSNFDVDTMLKIVDTDALLERYINARDTAHKVEDRYFEVDSTIINAAATTADDIEKMLYVEFKSLLDGNVAALKDILDSMDYICKRKATMYAFQEFVVRKNFLRGVMAMDERTFSQVSLNYFDFIFKCEHQVRTLLKTNDTATRNMIYSLLKIDIDARRLLTQNALQNITDAKDAYANGVPIFEYQFVVEGVQKEKEEGRIIVPKVLLHTAVSRENSYSLYYLNRTFTDLQSLIYIYHNLSSILEDAYLENRFNGGLFMELAANFTLLSKMFFGSRSNTLAEVIEFPVEQMQERIEHFRKLTEDFNKIYFDMKLNLESLVNKCRDIRDTVWPKYSSALKQARDYLNNQTTGKTPIAKVLINTDVKNHITQLDLFFNEVRTRSQTLYDNWSKFKHATFRIWKTILDDVDSKPYYEYANTSWGVLSYTNVTNETTKLYEHVRDHYDLRTVMGNRDNSFFRAFEKMSDDFQEYISANKLDTNFYKENFLQMDVFYRKLSYELVEQQKAYDIFALLCDIGGSMGLFVGASALTVFEVIDVFAYHLCKKAAPKKESKKKKNLNR
ncbi:uncharacterized protein LOC135497392 isoform X2 [Lineus longissimus]|uniref:uncharacterized protein LOC135497392 isoform X2 n=1 Tax=Lineus longissimus TaxID=88925 RepID=UPI00315DAD64